MARLSPMCHFRNHLNPAFAKRFEERAKDCIQDSHIFKQRLLFASVTLSYFLTGCAYIEKRDFPLEGPPTETNIRKANSQTSKIVRLFQNKFVALDTVPVGSILPYLSTGDLYLPENWRYCNGDLVDDPDSPLHGVALPRLMNDEFLMGTIQGQGSEGGNNQIPGHGQHTHAATSTMAGWHTHGDYTGPDTTNAPLKKVEDGAMGLRVVQQGHKHGIAKDGAHAHNISLMQTGLHDHGGDNRPRWFGVLYIIKIK